MKRIGLFTLVLTISLSVAAQFNFGHQSKVETKTIQSKVLNAGREYNIFLPLSYEQEPNRKYPILYLLHGVMDTNTCWSDRGHLKDVMDQLVASGETEEMIIVTPNAGGNIYGGAWNGYFDMPGWKYETFFFTEFLPQIESTYRVIGNKENRAIAGLSMGGGGATVYGQKHPDMFSSVYAMSALMSIPEQGVMPSQSPGDKVDLLVKSVQENCAIRYLQEADEVQVKALNSVKWFVDCGDDDFLLDRNMEFTQVMRKKGIKHEFRVRDGGHTWEYWHSALYTCLPYVSRNFGK
ncbi:esterase family protein [Bacteroides sp. 519]|uniref:alpha/beta hydrolase n=1 Tax=Bacteroides sp. 519 TaxID=2302937 RepID=UPI0013D456DB|nr:alpha/beta hydrolase-fold protein [Bacteroides sp. 519]NDV57047.1 esterase family protein [Bacteroides sp. 519]